MLEELNRSSGRRRRTSSRIRKEEIVDSEEESASFHEGGLDNADCRPCNGWIVALLTIAAPALGGATSLWGQALLAIATGCLFLVKPPSCSLGAVFNGAAIALILLAGVAFLPADWWVGDDWRARLAHIAGLQLPTTRSPQPWLTWEAVGCLLLALAWAYYLFGYVWNRKSAMPALRVFGCGIVVLAAAALFGFFTGHKVPFWPETGNSGVNFGFFPNRNQTANVLALGGIMVNALAFEALRNRRKSSAFWFTCLGMIGVALVIAYSRSGIVLFFGGIAVWALISTRLSTSTQSAAIAVSGAVLLLTALFLFGGETFQRFQAETTVMLRDFRLLIQWDAWKLASGAPWFGHGLGNFEGLFAMAREQSRMGNRAIHPESDWMWAAVEMGWLAPAILLGLFALWLKRCFPFEHGTAPLLRSAALIGGIGFVCHGLVDVSGHRLGSLWPALFLMSLALHPESARAPQAWVRPVFRLLGVLLIALGGWWLASLWLPLPTSASLQRTNARIDDAITRNQPGEVIDSATEALRLEPLDSNLYFQRARAWAVTYSNSQADRDFAIARALEPNWSEMCFDEGKLWLELDEPDRALDAWEEALRRPTDDQDGLFRRMLEATRTRYEVRDVLRIWSRAKRSYLLLYLETAARLEFELESDQLLAEDSTLQSFSPQQRNQFFRIWSQRRELSRLGPLLLAKPEWETGSWPYIARFYAEQGDFETACETVRKFAAMPVTPSIENRQTLPELEREFYVKSKDLVNGLALFGAQTKAGKLDDAAATLDVLKKEASPPRYLFVLDFDLHVQRQDWERAWLAWIAFESAPE
jgi:O-antigen ligase/tetratricopeptide (TPR) repeat protein